MTDFIFGKLTLSALPHEWFTIAGTISMIAGGISVAIFLTYFRRWKWLWQEWFTSVDPKKLGSCMLSSRFLCSFEEDWML